jgi:hypothetical protein
VFVPSRLAKITPHDSAWRILKRALIAWSTRRGRGSTVQIRK